jgi:hypothetical protein
MDVARFNPMDDAAVVAASFCCPFCLGRPARVHLHKAEGGESDATCSCDACEALWQVGLDPMQSMRLMLSPPPGLTIR